MNPRRHALTVAMLLASATAAQTYELNAVAVATGVADVTDSTTTGFLVEAINTGGSADPNATSAVVSTAIGGPASARAEVLADAQSLGPQSRGQGTARVDAVNDQVFFNASGPFRIRVSIELTRRHSVTWIGDVAQVIANGDWAVRDGVGGLEQAQAFRFNERNNGGTVFTITDQRDPLEFDLEPGESLNLSTNVRAVADAIASFKLSDGDAEAEIEAQYFVEVIEGDAQITSSTSGATYGPPPCNLADLTVPFGLLDLADTLVFVVAFQANDPSVDFDNSGLLDLADIVAFVSAFLADCP